jgi:PAS domain S-box-containing protein
MVLNKEGVVLAANKVVCTGLGVASEELIDKHFEDLKFIDKKTKMLIQSQLKKRLKGEGVENYEIPVLVNGETKYFEPRGNRIEYFGEPADLIVFHDVTERRQLQSQLLVKMAEKDEHRQESEEKYRKLFQESMDAIFVADAETGIIVDCNTAASLLVGREKSELIGQHQSILHPQTLVEEGFTKGFKQHVKNPTRSFETQVVTKTGEIKYVSIKANVFESQGKKLMQGTFRDITERKFMQQALQENEEKFRNLAEQSPNMIFINQKGKVVYANKEAGEAIGYTKEEFYSPDFNFLGLIAPEFKELVKSKFIKHMKSEDLNPYEYRLVRRDGRTIDVINNTRRIDYNGEPALLGVVTDITEIKKMREAVIESEEKFRAISDSAMDAIVLIGDKQKIVYWNPAVERIFGYKQEEALGKEATCLAPQHFRKPMAKRLEKLNETGLKPFAEILETMGRRKNGTEFPIEISSSRVQIRGRKYTVAIIRDATEQKRMQKKLKDYSSHLKSMVELRTAQLKDTNERLVKSERLATIGELAGMVGHDLRNPLAGMRGAVYYLKRYCGQEWSPL